MGQALTRNKYPSYKPLETIATKRPHLRRTTRIPPATTARPVFSIVYVGTEAITNPSDPVQLVVPDDGRGGRLVKAFKEYDSFERMWSGRRVTYGVASRCSPHAILSATGLTSLGKSPQHDFRPFVVLFCAEKVARWIRHRRSDVT